MFVSAVIVLGLLALAAVWFRLALLKQDERAREQFRARRDQRQEVR